MHHQPREKRTLFLVGKQRRIFRRDESIGIGADHHALRAVFETNRDVVADVLDAADPRPVDDVMPGPELANLRDAFRRDASHAGSVGKLKVDVHVDSHDDALLAEGVRRARDDVAVKKRAVEDAEIGVAFDLHALVGAEPTHLGVVVGDGLVGEGAGWGGDASGG